METVLKSQMQEKQKIDIAFYQGYIAGLYAKINQQRRFEDYYSYLDRAAGYLGIAIEKGLQEDKKFILPISWLFSLSTALKIDLQKAFIKRYPAICPYCLETECICLETGKRPSKDISISKIWETMDSKYEAVLNTMGIYDLDKAVENIRSIYPLNKTIWRFSGEWYQIARIHKEIAEIHEAYGSYKKNEKSIEGVGEEIADVLAWILGAWGIMYPDKSLDNSFQKYYSTDCPLCRKYPCECNLYDSRSDILVDINRLRPIKRELEKMLPSLPDQKDVRKLIRSYEDVLIRQHGPAARETASQTIDILEKIEDSISISDANSSQILSTVQALKKEINTILRIGEIASKPKEYDIFLSYSHQDEEKAQKLDDFLSRGKKLRVFRSKKDIQPGVTWEDDIQEALKNSKMLCILATPNSLGSEWVTTEWGAAWALKIPILPILLRCSMRDLPDRLKAHQAIDFDEMDKIAELIK
ncbi:MAG: toll/interleukin-1 receptor domain-containing protein [Anaerolineales bacterium]